MSDCTGIVAFLIGLPVIATLALWWCRWIDQKFGGEE